MIRSSTKLRWHDDFKINIPTIDAQHRQLFNTYTNLNQAIKDGLKPSVIEDSLDRLQLYVLRHFTMEEKYMKESEYPLLDKQVEEHELFSVRFSEILQEFKEAGMTASIVKSIQKELGQWLKHMSPNSTWNLAGITTTGRINNFNSRV